MDPTTASRPIQARLEAARLLDRLVRRLLTEDSSLHAETWILSLARMAGTTLQWDLGGGSDARVNARLDSHGPRLVALLLQVLSGLGHHLDEAGIETSDEDRDASGLTLEQTRARLAPLVQACCRAHALGPGEMADALTIATALAISGCEAVLPVARGAGLAVSGLVEGARIPDEAGLAA